MDFSGTSVDRMSRARGSMVRTGGGRMLALIAALLVLLAVTAVAAAGDAGERKPAPARGEAAAREASGTLVYYGRARMQFVRRPAALNSRSTHPAARSPGRCTSRSLPSA